MFITDVTENHPRRHVQNILQPVELILRYASQNAVTVINSWNYKWIHELNCVRCRQGVANRLYPAQPVVARPGDSLDVIVHRHCNIENAPRFVTTDDTSTEPSWSTSADWSISRALRGELHHRNTYFDGFNTSRSDACPTYRQHRYSRWIWSLRRRTQPENMISIFGYRRRRCGVSDQMTWTMMPMYAE